MIPVAPDPLPGFPTLVEHLVSGVYGACCMCVTGCCTWLDLIGAGLAPVADATGSLTDHAALHERCISTLLDHWASLGDHGGPGESTDLDDTDDDGGAQVLAGPAAPSLPPMGAYAQG